MRCYTRSYRIAFWVLCILFLNKGTNGQQRQKDTSYLKEFVIINKDPISEKYSVIKLKKLDIYFNPVSKGDALNAIQILPSSTNTDETANPALRGATADRSRIYLNGAPVLNPVRNAQNNGLGSFSILNTEMISKEYVYSSNPPLTYGNSSGGLVEIETTKKLEAENILISCALSNIGVMINKSVNRRSFIQAYSNQQFSGPLKQLNGVQLKDLNGFSSGDYGLNYAAKISAKIQFNTFNYAINEKYQSTGRVLNFEGRSNVQQTRLFSINNIDFIQNRTKLRISSLVDISDKRYQFGAINSSPQSKIFAVLLNHKIAITNNMTFQYGLDFFCYRYKFDETRPNYFFWLSPESPTTKNVSEQRLNYLELATYYDYKISEKIGFSAGIRSNLFISHSIPRFLSGQISAFLNLDNKNRIIVGGGNYYSYSTPTYEQHLIGLLNSKQLSIDFYHEKSKINVTAALYGKIDKSNYSSKNVEAFDKISTLGGELGLSHNFSKWLSLGISNSTIIQKGSINGRAFNTGNNLRYFIKAQISYNNPKVISAALTFSARPGNYYTSLSSSELDTLTKKYIPTFGSINGATLSGYSRLDLTLNKMFVLWRNRCIIFVTVSNLLNTDNQALPYYNDQYTIKYFQNYQRRIVYFGAQYRLENIFKSAK